MSMARNLGEKFLSSYSMEISNLKNIDQKTIKESGLIDLILKQEKKIG